MRFAQIRHDLARVEWPARPHAERLAIHGTLGETSLVVGLGTAHQRMGVESCRQPPRLDRPTAARRRNTVAMLVGAGLGAVLLVSMGTGIPGIAIEHRWRAGYTGSDLQPPQRVWH